jgi:hypothetical protein
MTNEMKLITALCDALGSDVEKICINQDAIDRGRVGLWQIENEGATQDGALYAYVPDPIFEYKVTKKVEHEDAELAAIVRSRLDQPEIKVPLNELLEEPFAKLKESDEIFNTEMFGKVSVRGPSSDLASSEYNQTSLSIDNDYQKGLVCRIYDSVSIGDVIKALDKLYIARGKA